MAFKSKDSLETGNVTIDNQHKELINAANDFLEACLEGKGRDNVAKTGKFLLDYTNKHFGDEEKLQMKSNYPDYQNHKKLHENFVSQVKALLSELDAQGPTVAIVGKINNLIAGWLFNHISKEDVKVAQHLKNQK